MKSTLKEILMSIYRNTSLLVVLLLLVLNPSISAASNQEIREEGVAYRTRARIIGRENAIKVGKVYEASEENFENFRGKNIVVSWRGLNFSSFIFSHDEHKNNFFTGAILGQPVFSSAAYEISGITRTGNFLSAPKVSSLFTSAQDIIDEILYLSNVGDPVRMNKKLFTNKRYALQQLYSNGYDRFFKALKNKGNDKSYGHIVGDLYFESNPFISCSTCPTHPGRYAMGLKDYSKNSSVLVPKYDERGKPITSFIGMVYGFFITPEMAAKNIPFSVPHHHEAGHIAVKTWSSCDILSEKEVSYVGYMPESSLCFKYPVFLPSFSTPYPGEYREQFGLTKRRYDNTRKIMTDLQTSPSRKKKKINQVLLSTISPEKKDAKKVYKNTLTHKLKLAAKSKIKEVEGVEAEIGLDSQVISKD